MAETQTAQQQTAKKSSIIGRVFGFLFISLFMSILVEWGLMWFEVVTQNAEHAKTMMNKEFGWFSSEFQQSLLYSKPVELAENAVAFVYQWVFIKTGLQDWLNSARSGGQTGIVSQQVMGKTVTVNYGSYTGAFIEYIEAALYVLITFIIRLLIIVLTSPLFILVTLVGITDGLVERDLRRFGVARESAFKYHYSKRAIGPVMIIGWIIYLALPFSLHPNWILIPSAILFGLMIKVTAQNFKKYL